MQTLKLNVKPHISLVCSPLLFLSPSMQQIEQKKGNSQGSQANSDSDIAKRIDLLIHKPGNNQQLARDHTSSYHSSFAMSLQNTQDRNVTILLYVSFYSTLLAYVYKPTIYQSCQAPFSRLCIMLTHRQPKSEHRHFKPYTQVISTAHPL